MGVPSFSGRGGQDRARGRHLTAANTFSAFGRFNQWGGGGGWGGAVRFWADSTSGEGGGGVYYRFRPVQSIRCPRFRQIQPVGGGGSATGGAHVCKQGGGGGGGGGGGAIQSLPPPPPRGRPYIHVANTTLNTWVR